MAIWVGCIGPAAAGTGCKQVPREGGTYQDQPVATTQCKLSVSLVPQVLTSNGMVRLTPSVCERIHHLADTCMSAHLEARERPVAACCAGVVLVVLWST